MTESGEPVPHDEVEGPRDPVLQSKYLDYCSARVAEVLLRLTPDEMYLLARQVAGEPGRDEPEGRSYGEIVRLATARIGSELALPRYRAWVREYRKDPERFEQELLGLWESDARVSEPGSR